MTVPEIAFALVATLVGMTVQSALGFGFAFFAAPVLLALRPVEEAVTTLLVLGIAINLLMLFAERRERSVLHAAVSPVLAASVPGMLLGVWLLTAVPKGALQITVGVVIVAASLVRPRPDAGIDGAPSVPAAGAYPVGLLSGTLTTATGVNGPPLILWFRALARRPAEVRDSTTASLLFLNVTGALAITLLASAERSADGLLTFAVLLPAVLVGHAAGRVGFRLLEGARRYETVVLGCLVAAGIASIVAGAA